jgi:hypothetical protein
VVELGLMNTEQRLDRLERVADRIMDLLCALCEELGVNGQTRRMVRDWRDERYPELMAVGFDAKTNPGPGGDQ